MERLHGISIANEIIWDLVISLVYALFTLHNKNTATFSRRLCSISIVYYRYFVRIDNSVIVCNNYTRSPNFRQWQRTSFKDARVTPSYFNSFVYID